MIWKCRIKQLLLKKYWSRYTKITNSCLSKDTKNEWKRKPVEKIATYMSGYAHTHINTNNINIKICFTSYQKIMHTHMYTISHKGTKIIENLARNFVGTLHINIFQWLINIEKLFDLLKIQRKNSKAEWVISYHYSYTMVARGKRQPTPSFIVYSDG